MPGQLSITIDGNTVSVPIKGTAAQIRAAVRRYARSVAIQTQDRTAPQVAEDVLIHLRRQIKIGSATIQRQEEMDKASTQIETTIAQDNDLYDEPPAPAPPPPASPPPA